MTFSVLARDPESGDLGIAVASCILAVGSAVPRARPGTGLVALQARSPRGLGGVLLNGLAEGTRPGDLVRRAAHAAEDAMRQVAVLSASGEVAADTGPDAFPEAGHRTGGGPDAGCAVLGNMLASPDVLPAMLETFDATSGALPDRLVAALRAGEEAGGDLRGRQSAALLVVSGTPETDDDDGVRVNLRVDDAADPIAALRVLRTLQRAHAEADYSTLAVFAPEGARDLYAALAAIQRGNRAEAREALRAMRERPGWSRWLAAMAGDERLAGVSRLLG